MKTIAILSGGIDSTTAMASVLAQMDSQVVQAVFFGYGQTHYEREFDAAIDVALYYGIRLKHLMLQHIQGSSLTGGHGVLDGVPTYVPNRNMIMISHAAALAVARDADTIVGGWHAGTPYPDCTEEFLSACEEAICQGTGRPITILRPLIHMSKAEVVNYALRLKVPLHLTWSCYIGGKVPCGECLSCQQRAAAFEAAGKEDPLHVPG